MQVGNAVMKRWKTVSSEPANSIHGHRIVTNFQVLAQEYQVDGVSCGVYCIETCRAVTGYLLKGESLKFAKLDEFDPNALRLEVLYRFTTRVNDAAKVNEKAREAKEGKGGDNYESNEKVHEANKRKTSATYEDTIGKKAKTASSTSTVSEMRPTSRNNVAMDSSTFTSTAPYGDTHLAPPDFVGANISMLELDEDVGDVDSHPQDDPDDHSSHNSAVDDTGTGPPTSDALSLYSIEQDEAHRYVGIEQPRSVLAPSPDLAFAIKDAGHDINSCGNEMFNQEGCSFARHHIQAMLCLRTGAEKYGTLSKRARERLRSTITALANL